MIKDKLFDILYSVFLGILGGLISMLYKNLQGKKFSMKAWLLNIVLAGLVAWLIGEFLPHDMGFRDGILGMSGVVSYQIVEFIQTFGLKAIKKYTGLGKFEEKKEDLSNTSKKDE